PSLESISIQLTTVSLNTNFDAYINVSFKGAQTDQAVPLLLDSGNSVLIVPKWEDIEALPNSGSDYRILGTGQEPWGCPAKIVRGPIDIATTTGDILRIPD